jgi:hypothetical protein
VVAAISEWTRAEAVASARRLAAIAEWVRRHADGPTDCAHWSCDNWDAMAAEVGAAQGISHRMASGQMYLAVALHNRLPRVAALFAQGTISARLASTIVWHTDLIKDPETLRLVDENIGPGRGTIRTAIGDQDGTGHQHCGGLPRPGRIAAHP